jgi:hypothetical protein
MAVAPKHLVPLDFFLGSDHLIDGYMWVVVISKLWKVLY